MVIIRKEQAKQLLKHYFKLIFDKCGIKYDSDVFSEIDEIVDLIVLQSEEYTDEQLADHVNNSGFHL